MTVEATTTLTKKRRPLLVLLGPTAVGKTALSLHLAKHFNGEIVSADSRLFYRGMDIGTAKPAKAERDAIRHHLVDIVEPNTTVTLGSYQAQAYAAIDRIHKQGKLPILVGGTGQYVMAVVEGWGIPRIPPHAALRRALQRLEPSELYRWLAHLDPESAERIHPNNVRRIIRALEVTLISGQRMSELQRKKPPPYEICIIGLHRERESLYQRIDKRIEKMMANGLLDEVRRLRDAGYDARLPAMSGLGYRQLWDYLEGKTTLEEAVERIKYETHRFVRHQNNWFQKDDPRIQWFNAGEEDTVDRIEQFVAGWLRQLAPEE